MTTRRPDWIALAALALVAAPAGAQSAGVPMRAPRPEEYGGVVMERLAAKGAGAVSFSHWLHRARYTCRLCHLDLGFAVVANQTRRRAPPRAEGRRGRPPGGGSRPPTTVCSPMTLRAGRVL